MSHLQTFFPVQAMNVFVNNLPAFAPQQHMNTLIPVAHPRRRDFANAFAKNLLLNLAALVVVGRAACP